MIKETIALFTSRVDKLIWFALIVGLSVYYFTIGNIELGVVCIAASFIILGHIFELGIQERKAKRKIQGWENRAHLAEVDYVAVAEWADGLEKILVENDLDYHGRPIRIDEDDWTRLIAIIEEYRDAQDRP